LPIALGTLVVLSLLAAAMLATASRSSTDSERDRASKRALAAAEAGLQTAAYRLKRLNPAGTMCLTTVAVAPTAGECPASTPEIVGTGETFSYRVTPKGATCSTVPGFPVTANDRCITSVGVATGAGLANGVKRRVQTRVEFGPAYPFAKAGVAGTESVTLNDDVMIDQTDVGSNGPITLTGSPKRVDITDDARPYPPGPPGSVVIRTGVTSIRSTYDASGPYGFDQPDFAPTLPPTGTNNNAALLSSGHYNAVTRALSIPADALTEIPAGTYNLCSVTMAPGADFRSIASSDVINIYLDSPRRPGSGCPPGSGKFRAVGDGSQPIKMNNGRFDANMRYWVYGTTADASAEDILLSSKGHFDAVWYAPDSIFHATNDILMHGGVLARKVLMDHDVFAKLDVAVKSLVGPGSGALSRRAWAECTPVPTVPTDPESGC
jgi:type II secretory pathway pseudopilin PulG